MWYRIATERFGATDPRSGRLRFFSGNSGTTLTAQQPLNNIVRSTIQCLGAVLGGAQSIHVMGYDEALRDPVGGGRDALAAHPADHRARVRRRAHGRSARRLVLRRAAHRRDRGRGRARCSRRSRPPAARSRAIEPGVPQRWIAESAYRTEREIADGRPAEGGRERLRRRRRRRRADVGVFDLDAGVVERQIARTAERVAARDPRGARRGDRARWTPVARAGGNVMPAADRGGPRRRDASARCPTCSGACSGSSGSRTRGERAARGAPRPRPHAVRRGVAGDRDARRARRRGDQDRGAARGDPYRVQGTERVGGESVLFMSLNSGKRSVALDFRAPAAADAIERLLASLGLPGGERAAGEPGARTASTGSRCTPATRDRLRVDLRLRRRRARGVQGRVRPHPAGGERRHERHGEPRSPGR